MAAWLTKTELVEKVHLSYVSIWKLIVAGDFPRGKQVSSGSGKLLWREADVDAWIESRPDQFVRGDQGNRPVRHLNLRHVEPTTATAGGD